MTKKEKGVLNGVCRSFLYALLPGMSSTKEFMYPHSFEFDIRDHNYRKKGKLPPWAPGGEEPFPRPDGPNYNPRKQGISLGNAIREGETIHKNPIIRYGRPKWPIVHYWGSDGEPLGTAATLYTQTAHQREKYYDIVDAGGKARPPESTWGQRGHLFDRYKEPKPEYEQFSPYTLKKRRDYWDEKNQDDIFDQPWLAYKHHMTTTYQKLVIKNMVRLQKEYDAKKAGTFNFTKSIYNVPRRIIHHFTGMLPPESDEIKKKKKQFRFPQNYVPGDLSRSWVPPRDELLPPKQLTIKDDFGVSFWAEHILIRYTVENILWRLIDSRIQFINHFNRTPVEQKIWRLQKLLLKGLFYLYDHRFDWDAEKNWQDTRHIKYNPLRKMQRKWDDKRGLNWKYGYDWNPDWYPNRPGYPNVYEQTKTAPE